MYGPLLTTDLFNGRSFESHENPKFRMETLEPWLAFTLKIPVDLGNARGLFLRSGQHIFVCVYELARNVHL